MREKTHRVWKLGDNISTDQILPSRYMTQIEPNELAAHCLAGLDPAFSSKILPGDIIAAGGNIGYGSSREQAPQALKHAGISAVIAKSFARIFYRNCYNVGLAALVCPAFAAEAETGDEARIDLAQSLIFNINKNREYEFAKQPEFLLEYIRLGGLLPYLRQRMEDNICGHLGQDGTNSNL